MTCHTFICIPCKSTRRAEPSGTMRSIYCCPTCGEKLWDIGDRGCIPKRGDKKGWRSLSEFVKSLKIIHHRDGEDKLKKLDREIDIVTARESSEEVESLLSHLRSERKLVINRYWE